MKKTIISLVLVLCLLLSASSALALDYSMYLDNEASFESLEEARANESDLLMEKTGRQYVPDPALDDYPEGTTWIYRSAKMSTPLTAAPRSVEIRKMGKDAPRSRQKLPSSRFTPAITTPAV